MAVGDEKKSKRRFVTVNVEVWIAAKFTVIIRRTSLKGSSSSLGSGEAAASRIHHVRKSSSLTVSMLAMRDLMWGMRCFAHLRYIKCEH